MPQKIFSKKYFSEWKSDIITIPLLETCKSITLSEDFIKHQQSFCTIKNAKVFKNAFQRMTDDLFEYGVKVEYVIVSLAFCLSLDEKRLVVCDWYNTELVIDTLHTVRNLILQPFIKEQ